MFESSVEEKLAEFESSVQEKLAAYVYALIDPRTDRPFYIGKGRGNRVFSHAARKLNSPNFSDKYDTIEEILNSGMEVRHLILRHGMTDQVAFEVESALIDFCSVINHQVTNIVSGHGASIFGAMTTDEIKRMYRAEPLDNIEEGFVLININRTYRRAQSLNSYYEATKESWSIKKSRLPSLKYALSEYKGFIVEVFKIKEWYEVKTENENKKSTRIRWGFNGTIAEAEVRNRYLNKTIKKIRGASNPIRYNYANKG